MAAVTGLAQANELVRLLKRLPLLSDGHLFLFMIVISLLMILWDCIAHSSHIFFHDWLLRVLTCTGVLCMVHEGQWHAKGFKIIVPSYPHATVFEDTGVLTMYTAQQPV